MQRMNKNRKRFHEEHLNEPLFKIDGRGCGGWGLGRTGSEVGLEGEVGGGGREEGGVEDFY